MLRFLTVFIDLAAFVAQCSVYFIISSTQFTAYLSKPLTTTTTAAPNINEQSPLDVLDPLGSAVSTAVKLTSDSLEQAQIKFGWEAPVALICVSIVWWENYVDRDIKLGKISIPLGTYKRHLQSVRSKANIGASIWKIALTVAFSFLLLPRERFDNVFVNFVNGAPPVNPSLDGSSGIGMDMNSFDAVSPSNQFDLGNTDLPVRHRRQIPAPIDDNSTLMGKVGAGISPDQMAMFPTDEEQTVADPFDFQPDRVKHEKMSIHMLWEKIISTFSGKNYR